MGEKHYTDGQPDAAEEHSLFNALAGRMEQNDQRDGQQDDDGATEGSEDHEGDAGEGQEGAGNGADQASAQGKQDEEARRRERDEQGRFAKPDQRQGNDRHEQGLRKELTSEREARRAVEARYEADRQELARLRGTVEALQRMPQQAAPQQPKEETPPDRWTDPDGYDRWREAQIERKFNDRLEQDTAQRIEFSLQTARSRDTQKFDAAYAYTQTLPAQELAAIKRDMRHVSDPGAYLIETHRQAQARQSIGHDPQAFIERTRNEILNNPAELMKNPDFARAVAEYMRQQAGGRNGASRSTTVLPPSLNGARGGNRQESYDDTEAGLFASITRS